MSTINFDKKIENLSWRKLAALILVLVLVDIGAMYGANITVDWRITDIEDQLWTKWNPTFYTTNLVYDWVISSITSGETTYYCAQNGTDGKLAAYNTNFSYVVNNARNVLGSLSTGASGTIFVKNGTYQQDTDIILGKKTHLIGEGEVWFNVTANMNTAAIVVDSSNVLYTDWSVEGINVEMNYFNGHGFYCGWCSYGDMRGNQKLEDLYIRGIGADYWALVTYNPFVMNARRISTSGNLGNGWLIKQNLTYHVCTGNSYFEDIRIGIGVNKTGILIETENSSVKNPANLCEWHRVQVGGGDFTGYDSVGINITNSGLFGALYTSFYDADLEGLGYGVVLHDTWATHFYGGLFSHNGSTYGFKFEGTTSDVNIYGASINGWWDATDGTRTINMVGGHLWGSQNIFTSSSRLNLLSTYQWDDSLAKWVISTDGTNYYSQNMHTGQTYKSTSLSYVFNVTVDACMKGKIVFTAGEFVFTSVIDIPDNSQITIEGSGMNQTWIVFRNSTDTTNTSFLTIGEVYSFDMFDLTIDANMVVKHVLNWTGASANRRVPAAFIERCYLRNASDYVLRFYEGVDEAIVLRHNRINMGAQGGVHMGQMADSFIENNYIGGIWYGSSIYAASLYINGYSNKITGNYLGGSANIGLYLAWTEDNIIANNIIDHAARWLVYVRSSSDNTFSGNRFSAPCANSTNNATQPFIRMEGSDADRTYRNIFTGNTFVNITGYNYMGTYCVEEVGSYVYNNEYVANIFAGYTISALSLSSSSKTFHNVGYGYDSSTATYIISTDGTNYYMEHGRTGQVYSSTNASQVFQTAREGLGTLATGAAGEIRVRKGTYQLSKDIIIGKNTHLIAESGAIFNVTANLDNGCIVIDSTYLNFTDWRIEGMRIQMNQYNGHGIYSSMSSGAQQRNIHRIANLFIVDVKAGYSGIYIKAQSMLRMDNLYIRTYGTGITFRLRDSDPSICGNSVFTNVFIVVLENNGIGVDILGNPTKDPCDDCLWDRLQVNCDPTKTGTIGYKAINGSDFNTFIGTDIEDYSDTGVYLENCSTLTFTGGLIASSVANHAFQFVGTTSTVEITGMNFDGLDDDTDGLRRILVIGGYFWGTFSNNGSIKMVNVGGYSYGYDGSTASYIISTNGVYYFMEHGRTGQVYSSTNASQVFQLAREGLGTLATGAAGTIQVKLGNYNLDSPIIIGHLTHLIGEPNVVFNMTANSDCIRIAIDTDGVEGCCWQIRNFDIRMNGLNGNGIYSNNASRKDSKMGTPRIEGVKIWNVSAGYSGIELNNFFLSVISGVSIRTSGWGIKLVLDGKLISGNSVIEQTVIYLAANNAIGFYVAPTTASKHYNLLTVDRLQAMASVTLTNTTGVWLNDLRWSNFDQLNLEECAVNLLLNGTRGLTFDALFAMNSWADETEGMSIGEGTNTGNVILLNVSLPTTFSSPWFDSGNEGQLAYNDTTPSSPQKNTIISANFQDINYSLGYNTRLVNCVFWNATSSNYEQSNMIGTKTGCINGTWIAHNLVQAPTIIVLTISGNNYINASAYYIQPTVIASNSTHFQISFLYFSTNSPYINAVTATQATTIMWEARVTP